jgi:hypothetical protein
MKTRPSKFQTALLALCILGLLATAAGAPPQALDDPSAPSSVVKLIFIHHSSGENWLTDGNGDLGKTLGQNNYFVSDTNYGWGPNGIGDRTDIPNWLEWFRSGNTATYMAALFNESGQNSSYTRTLTDPGGENEIIMFKSCFPNSNLSGNPTDPPKVGSELAVGNAKYIYNELLRYFATKQNKLFIVITAPPVTDPTYAENARAFNNWLINDWLNENHYPYGNVAVFDFYNVLTGPNNHHRYVSGSIEHVYTAGMNTAYYASGPGDDHPSKAGNLKAKNEFIPLLNIFYHRWKAGLPTLHKYTLSINSTGAEDGWTLESSETSGQGGTLRNGVLAVGDNAGNRQYRAILSFDTSSLPDNAWITSVVLKVKKSALLGTNPFTTHQNLYVDLRKPYFGPARALAVADFQAGASRTMVGKFNPTPASGWYSATLGNTAYQWVSLTATTQFRLRFQLDDNDDGGADMLQFYSGTAAAANQPVLVIQYYIP